MQYNNILFWLTASLFSSAANTVQAFQQGKQCSSLSSAIPAGRGFLSSNASSNTSPPLGTFSSSNFRSTQHFFLNSPASSRKETKLDAFTVGSALAVADTFWQTSPYTAAALVCAIKGSIADLVAQKYFTPNIDAGNNKMTKQKRKSETSKVVPPQRNRADWRRNIAYAIYGSICQGIIQEYMLNHVYPILFGNGTDLRTIVMKVAFNLLVHSPLFTIPVAYVVKAILYKHSMREAFSKYVNDIRYHGLLTKFYMLWGPVQSLTFSVVPPHLRVTFIAVISFFWMIILSATASKPSPAESKA